MTTVQMEKLRDRPVKSPGQGHIKSAFSSKTHPTELQPCRQPFPYVSLLTPMQPYHQTTPHGTKYQRRIFTLGPTWIEPHVTRCCNKMKPMMVPAPKNIQFSRQYAGGHKLFSFNVVCLKTCSDQV